jgi:uncharacterized LabA/DUF88 family protein
MNDIYYFPEHLKSSARAMVFVDGENLAIRYGKILDNNKPEDHVVYEQDVLVWSHIANFSHHSKCEIIRRYYYTCVSQDEVYRSEIEDKLKAVGIEAPRVFNKVRGKKSKRVDIALATDMLTHAHRKNYDIAVLVAGDEDYIPLVEAVMAEGCRVVLWFFDQNSGLSNRLKKTVDHFFNIGTIFFHDLNYLRRYGY